MAEIIVTGALNALCSALTTTIRLPQLYKWLGMQMRNIEKDLKDIQDMLRYIDQMMEMEENKQFLGKWVEDVQYVAYQVEDIVESCMYDLADDDRTRCQSPTFLLTGSQKLRKIQLSIQKILDPDNGILREKLLSYQNKEKGSSSLRESGQQKFSPYEYWNEDLDDGLFSLDKGGKNQPKKLLEGWILSAADNNYASFDPRNMCIAVWGMGGLGKTTLLEQIIHGNRSLRKEFDCVAWITVSKTYGHGVLLRELLEQLVGTNSVEIRNSEEKNVVEMIRSIICQKRYLIVFDDVWQDDFWSKIQILFHSSDDPCSRILFSTRHQKVALSVARRERVMRLSHLNPEQSWFLFCKKAFWQENPPSRCPDELVDIGKKIVRKCGGLPLAIVTVAGMGYSEKRSVLEWENSYRMLCNELSSISELSILMHSYYDLPACLKQCFLYCCAFSEDWIFYEKYIISLWVAEGFIEENDGKMLEDTGKAYLEELVRRSMMIQKFDGDSTYPVYKIHGTLRALGLDISRRQNFGAIVDGYSKYYSPYTRRLSIYESMGVNIPELPTLRTLRVSRGMDELVKYCSFRNFKLLKVLDLEGVQMSDINIPRGIFKLFNLRHLNLSNTGIKEDVFPSEIGWLRNLLYLDISETGVKRLPRNIGNLQKLRRLLCGDDTRGIQVPAEIFDLKDLQCLRYIEATGGDVVEQLGNLTQLRQLGITEVKHSHKTQLCSSLNRMAHLTELDVITAEDEEDPIDLESLNHTQIQKLVLFGAVKGISTWCKSLQSLRYLFVSLNYELQGGSDGALLFDSLKSLPHLKFVGLFNAFQGTKLSFPSLCFPSLRELFIANSDNLTSIEIEDFAPPNLRRIRIYSCPNLIPPKADLLEGLEEIHMEDMPPQVVQHFQEMCTQSSVKLIVI